MLAKSLKISKLFKLILGLPGRNCGFYQRMDWGLSHRLEDLPEGSLVVGWSQTLVLLPSKFKDYSHAPLLLDLCSAGYSWNFLWFANQFPNKDTETSY